MNFPKKIFFFVGASGVGKSTLINYLRENFTVDAKEISARPYLPKKEGSYDQILTDESQAVIVQSRTLTVLEDLFSYQQGTKTIPTIYSRSPICNLAYSRVLSKGLFLESLNLKEIEICKQYCYFIYIPVEFEMVENDDKVRGTNREVQLETDTAIVKIMSDSGITPFILTGSIEERFKKLNYIFIDYKIN
jgi:predicted ATPase